MIELDERGKPCPLPVVEAKRALEAASDNETVKVCVDNEIAVQNLQKMAEHKGYHFFCEKKGDREYQVRLSRGSGVTGLQDTARAASPVSDPAAQPPGGSERGGREGTVVVIGSDCMGNGDERLGKLLMKGFLFALAGQEELPETILFYNRGAFLTCGGSDSLEDLRNLEDKGVELLTCGTCLDFYGLKESLAVGQVTNMYEITEKQMNAAKTVRP